MARRADFVFFSVDEELGGLKNVVEKEFFIEGNPKGQGQGYILIQTFGVQSADHRIVINDQELPSWDLPAHPGPEVWQTWMDRIPVDVLVPGKNRLRIHKAPGIDTSFKVRGVSINWREEV